MMSTIQLQSNSQQLSYQVAGAGEPLVLIHGVGMQSEAWRPQIDYLSKTHKVFALDMPGHGGSTPLAPDATLPDFVEWLHNALTALQLNVVGVIGHSMGALIVAGFTICYPQKVKYLALLNAVFKRNAKASAAVQARAAEIRAGIVDFEAPLQRWFGDSEQNIRNDVAKWLQQMDVQSYATAYTAFAKSDAIYADKWHLIACPLLALTADGDINSTPEMSQNMAEIAQNGEAVIIKGHRHMVSLTAADIVNNALSDWLTKCNTKYKK